MSDSEIAASAGPRNGRPAAQRRWLVQLAVISRWLHIYLSMISFAVLLFFAVTGITLNHPDWFGAETETVVSLDGRLPVEWLEPVSRTTNTIEDSEDIGPAHQLQIVEHLRSTHQLRGAVREFRSDEAECLIFFRGPSYAAEVYIQRSTGAYSGTVTAQGTIALLNDLHKGRDTGTAWSWLIDLSAAAMIVISLTGLVLICCIRRKRFSGLVTAAVGAALCLAAYWLWVP